MTYQKTAVTLFITAPMTVARTTGSGVNETFTKVYIFTDVDGGRDGYPRALHAVRDSLFGRLAGFDRYFSVNNTDSRYPNRIEVQAKSWEQFEALVGAVGSVHAALYGTQVPA